MRSRNKRRKGGRKPPSEKNGRDPKQAYETFDINVHDKEVDSEGEEEVEKVPSNYPSQLRDFKGKERTLIDRARFLFQIYLLTYNGFPCEEEIQDWSREAYKHAAIYVYKDRYEGKSVTVPFFHLGR